MYLTFDINKIAILPKKIPININESYKFSHNSRNEGLYDYSLLIYNLTKVTPGRLNIPGIIIDEDLLLSPVNINILVAFTLIYEITYFIEKDEFINTYDIGKKVFNFLMRDLIYDRNLIRLVKFINIRTDFLILLINVLYSVVIFTTVHQVHLIGR